MKRFYTKDNDPDVKPIVYPLLCDKLRELKKQFQEAEFEGNKTKCVALSPKIKSVEYAISVGEEYDIPF